MKNKFGFITILLALSFVAVACQPPQSTKETNMTISSPAFEANGPIPRQYTCDGQNINPPLKFGGLPADAKSLALIVDDPDAPNGTFVHWVVADIPAGTTMVNEHDPLAQATAGRNGSGKTGYTGPCPPSGTHHYHFKLFALDTLLNLSQPDAKQLEEAMQSHIMGQTELVGVYQRQ